MVQIIIDSGVLHFVLRKLQWKNSCSPTEAFKYTCVNKKVVEKMVG